MKLGEIRISRSTTNEPNEPSRAREISARRSPSRAGITLLVRWLRGGSARSYARLVWLVCDARRVCSARCQPSPYAPHPCSSALQHRPKLVLTDPYAPHSCSNTLHIIHTLPPT